MTGGRVRRVNGPVIEVECLDAAMLELVEVGEGRLPGEVISLSDGTATVQVYEYTGGLRPGTPVRGTGTPLSVELGPGLLGGVYDGMLRRLDGAATLLGSGQRGSTLDLERRWHFEPAVEVGAEVRPGAVLGLIQETPAIAFRVLAPEGVAGAVEWLATGECTVSDPVARIAGRELTPAHRWPVRRPRPIESRIRSGAPLVTGQRALDLFFPVARGSSAAIPGGFGTGKTVLLQQIAKWCDADVIVYVGCGERGNEMADVLQELTRLDDPRTGRALLDRTILIANTSNMPVLAREASIYTGVAVAELYRDMGYDAVVIADSTSRWAEALREVGSRTGELPAEEGYPASLASALAAFYERAGCVRTLSGEESSLTILGAVSPAGGDMTEPVSAHTRRLVRCVWSLDPDLAYSRHYPAVSWQDSSSRDAEGVGDWHLAAGGPGWAERRLSALTLLSEADHLESVAELVGQASLPDHERIVLAGGRLIREAVLQQSSLSDNDAFCAPEKQEALLQVVLRVHDRSLDLVAAGVPASVIEGLDLSELISARETTPSDGAAAVRRIGQEMLARLDSLG